MKKLLATVLFVALCTLSFSQKSPVSFGNIAMEDMEMKTYNLDSSAAAVILADYGKAYISISSVNASLVLERHVRIKILKKEGLKWADAEISLYHSASDAETVSNLKAVTYNLEGGKIVETKVDKSGIFKEKFNRNIDIQKFTFPNVKEGSVIEYSYKLNSSFVTNFPNWQFQYDIPSRISEYWAIIPDFFIMEKYMQGYLQPAVYETKDKNQQSYSEKAQHWVMKDVPAFKEEPFITCEDDYVSKVNFALAYINFPGQPSQEVMGSWEKLNKNLLESESFGKIITGSGSLKKDVDELLAGETDQLKKVEKIYNYVRQTIEWDGVKDIYGEKPKDVLEKKKGTAADINLTLAAMLDKAGFMVDMVLVSTRDHGFVRQQYPMSEQFNYTVCAVRINGTPTFLDATEKYLPVGVLPERCLNGQGLLISKNFHGWINLETKTKAKTVVNATLTLDSDDNLQGKISFSRDGYDANSMRKDYVAKGEEEYIKNFSADMTSWQISKSTFENVKEIDKAVNESHELVISEHVVAAGDILYINPFVTSQIKENPFTLDTRTYPVDYGSLREKVYMCKITIPDGYTVDELPQSKVLALPGNAAKYLFSVNQLGNVINIVSNFQINKNIFIQGEYPNLREFYNLVVAKQAEQIVLKKK